MLMGPPISEHFCHNLHFDVRGKLQANCPVVQKWILELASAQYLTTLVDFNISPFKIHS